MILKVTHQVLPNILSVTHPARIAQDGISYSPSKDCPSLLVTHPADCPRWDKLLTQQGLSTMGKVTHPARIAQVF